ncbi:carboxymuconolactone decarboxylase family protein [Amycolatopsis cynarae]|uniref:Carboxymuconolactone decarboxylase family protein n=1 Tax=Amycolatopsis cynarae TaxID=2995223 RepID=A0ABY7AU01_9PSEU|nr:carboxymuconolactone decarboxylase family protein [Amycolatopsis sp. HUAS 11-8]WAL63452.1 carboxymuconolactone decarboxylase family protein [Amycolatopsis sp. HUAS 11-8]
MTVDSAIAPDLVGELDPLFAQLARATTAHAGDVPGLTEREKVFLRLVADVCQGALGLPFELHVRSGLAQGVSTSDMRDLIRFVAYDTGYPAALGALARLAEIEEADGLPRPEAALLPAAEVSTGPDATPTPLPASVLAEVTGLDPHFGAHLALQSRMRSGAGSGSLSVRERAFATMSVDVHYQTLEESFTVHVSRALGAGASHEDVRSVLRFAAQFGITRAWRAWKALNALLATLA